MLVLFPNKTVLNEKTLRGTLKEHRSRRVEKCSKLEEYPCHFLKLRLLVERTRGDDDGPEDVLWMIPSDGYQAQYNLCDGYGTTPTTDILTHRPNPVGSQVNASIEIVSRE